MEKSEQGTRKVGEERVAPWRVEERRQRGNLRVVLKKATDALQVVGWKRWLVKGSTPPPEGKVKGSCPKDVDNWRGDRSFEGTVNKNRLLDKKGTAAANWDGTEVHWG